MKNVQDAKKIIGILRSVRWIKARALSHMKQINDVVSVASAITSATEQEDSSYSEIPEDDGSFNEESLESMFISVFPDDFIQEKSIIINGDQKTLQDMSDFVDASREILDRLNSIITEEMEASVVTTKADGSGNFKSNLDELRKFCESLIDSFDSFSDNDKKNLAIVITDGVNKLIDDLSSVSGVERFRKLNKVYLKNEDSFVPLEPQEETISEELRRRNLLYAARCRRLKELADAGDERAERLYLKMKCRQEEPSPQEETISEESISEESISEEPPVEAEPEISLDFEKSLDKTVYITSKRDSEIIEEYFEASGSEVYASIFAPKTKKGTITPDKIDKTEIEYITAVDKYMSAVGWDPKTASDELYGSEVSGNDPGSFYESIGTSSFLDFDGSIFFGKFKNKNMEDAIGIKEIPGSDSEPFLLEVDDEKIKKIKDVLDKEVVSIIESSNRIYNIAAGSPDPNGIDDDIAKKINVYRRFLIKKIDYFFASIKSRDAQVTRYLRDQYPATWIHADGTYGKLDEIINKCLITKFYIDAYSVPEDDRLGKLSSLLVDRKLSERFIDAIIKVIRPGLRNNVFERKFEKKLYGKYKSYKYRTDGFSEDLGRIIDSVVSKKILDSMKLDKSNTDASKLAFSIRGELVFQNLLLGKLASNDVTRVVNSCPVCKRQVYKKYKATTRKGGVSGPESDEMRQKAEDPVNNIKIDTYSLFKNLGGMITFDDLTREGRKFELSSDEKKVLKDLGEKLGANRLMIDRELRPKTWEEIEKDWKSGSYFNHISALYRKSFVLKNMGGKKLNTPSSFVATSRIRCPFGPDDDPAAKKYVQSIGSGRDLDIGKFKKDLRKELGLDLRTAVSQEYKKEMEEIIDNAFIGGGGVEEMQINLEVFINELPDEVLGSVADAERKKKAAYDFLEETVESFKMESLQNAFSCGLPEENQVVSGLDFYLDDAVKSGSITQAAKDKMLELSSYQPSGGFRFSSRSFVCPTEIEVIDSEDAEGKIKTHGLLAMPIPSSPPNQVVSDGKKILSLYCGAKTSISQFDRAKFAEKIRGLMEADSEEYSEIIESMMQLGVDVSDILPFVMTKHAHNESALEGSSADILFDSLIADDLISRSKKISLLLKQAMATSSKETVSGQVGLKDYFDAIEDIELKCVHNHNFKVSDSIDFAHSYIDIDLTKNKVEDIVRLKILEESGHDQLDAIFEMKDAPIKRVLEQDMYGLKSYEEFVFGQDSINRVYFPNPNLAEGNLRYALKDGILSMYPGGSRLTTHPIDKAVSTVSGQSLRALHNRVEAGRVRDDAVKGEEGSSGESLVENLKSDTFLDPEAALLKDRDEIDVKSKIETLEKHIKKNEALILALVQSYIISIQELLIASTATNPKTATILGSGIAKEKVVKGGGIKIPNFDQNLKGLVAKIISGESEAIYDEDAQYSEIARESIGNISKKLIEDVGGDARAFIYNMRGAFKDYLHRLIVSGILAALPGDRAVAFEGQSVEDVRSRLFALKIEDVVSAFSNIFYVDKSDTPEGSSQSSETIETSEGKKFVKDMAKEIGKLSKGNVRPIVMNVTETWLGKQVVTAATAFYIAERLSSIYNKFFSKNSVSYIGYEPLGGLAPENGEMTPKTIVSITVENLLLNNVEEGSIIKEMRERKAIAGDYASLILEQESAIKELARAYSGAAYACRSSYYQSEALEYIKSVYKEVLASEASTASEKSYSESIINRVIANVKNIEVSLAPPGDDSKYSSYFAEPNNSHILLPSITHPILIPSSEALSEGLSKPIYVIKNIEAKQRGYRENNYILDIKRELIAAYDYALLIHAADLDKFLAISQMAESVDFSDSHKEFYNNGWRLFVGRGSKIPGAGEVKDDMVSIANHPGSEITRDEAGDMSGYINNSLDIDTSFGIHVGQYGQHHLPSKKAYPPNAGANCGIGIPLPILLENLKSIRAPKDAVNVSLVDIPFIIQTPEGRSNLEINLSDLLMRNPPEKAANILLQINREYKKFKEKHDKLDSSRKEEAKKGFSKYARSKMKEYRSLPLYIALETGARTLKDGEKFSANTGLYVPLINPVLANMLISNDCFREEYACSKIIPKSSALDVGIDQSVNYVKHFIASLFGYDKLAELMNSYIGPRRYVSQGKAVKGTDLLDPYKLLFEEETVSMSALWGEAREGSGPIEVVLDNGEAVRQGQGELPDGGGVVTELVFGSSTASERFSETFDVRIPEWRHYIPKFKVISVSGDRQDNKSGFGIPKFILDGPIFRREGERDFESIRDLQAGTDVLDIGDLKSLVSTRMPEGKSGVIRTYGFSDSLEKFFGKKFDAIESFMKEYEENLVTQDVYSIYGPKKAMIFDSASLFNKISSSIICKNFIKKSEKYRTDIFKEIIIRDEAIIRLLDSIS